MLTTRISASTGYSILHIAPAAALAVAVALTQQYLAHTENLTPWKGGGFGMFSTVDSRGARLIECYLVRQEDGAPETMIRVPIPNQIREIEEMVNDLRSLPSQARLDELASMLVEMPWARPKRWQSTTTETRLAEDPTALGTGDEAQDMAMQPDSTDNEGHDERPVENSATSGDPQFARIIVDPEVRPNDGRWVPIRGVVVKALVIRATRDGNQLIKTDLIQARATR